MERAQQIAALRRELHSAFPTSYVASSPGRPVEFPGLSTGLETLDDLLGGRGLPRGRLSELTGAPSSGKTTLAFRIMAAATQAGMPVAYIDPTLSFFPPAAAAAGIALDRLLLVQVPELAGSLRAADILLRGQAFPLVVFDLAVDPPPGQEAVELGSTVARLNGLCALSETVFLFITSPRTARDPLRYYASVRLEVRHGGPQAGQDGLRRTELTDEAAGRRLRLVGLPGGSGREALSVQVIKNKLGPPGGRIEVLWDGRKTAGLPLHPGIPDSSPSAR